MTDFFQIFWIIFSAPSGHLKIMRMTHEKGIFYFSNKHGLVGTNFDDIEKEKRNCIILSDVEDKKHRFVYNEILHKIL